jgi:hypothetical protein
LMRSKQQFVTWKICGLTLQLAVNGLVATLMENPPEVENQVTIHDQR